MTEPVGSAPSRTVRLFLRNGFVWQVCWSSYWTLFFLRVVVDVGLSPFQLLMLGTTKEVTILLSEIPTGVVADIRSRRTSVILAFLICGTAIVGAGIATTFVALVFTQALWAFGTTFKSGAETAWFTDEVGSVELVDPVLPRRARFEAVGSIVGLALTALLAAATDLSTALVATGMVLIVWGFVLKLRMPETGFQRHQASARIRVRQLLGEGFRAARRPGLRVLLIATVATGFASEAADRLAVARLDEVGLRDTISPALLVGGAAVAQSVGAFVLLFVFGRHLAGARLVTALVVLNSITAVGVGLLARGDILAIALTGMVIQGTARSIARTATIGWTNHFTDQANRATVHSFVGQSQSLGEISGGIVLGVVAQRLGISAALTASALIYLLAAGWTQRGWARWSQAPS